MRQPLAITAVFAWILIQVPLVFCDTGCGPALASILTLDGHRCHDEASVAHQTECAHGCRHHTVAKVPQTPETAPTRPGSDDPEGDHVIVQVQGASGGPSMALPAPVRRLAVVLSLSLDPTLTTLTSSESSDGMLTPPRPAVPVLRVTQLLL